MVRRTVEAMRPLADAGKLGSYLLQLTSAFDPRRERARRLAPVIDGLGPAPVGVEFRRRSWALPRRFEGVLDWLSAHDAVLVCVDTPPGAHVPIFPPIDAVTNDSLAYMRCHGRNTEGYLHGRSVAERFDYDYSKTELEEIAGRAEVLDQDAEQVHVMFNNTARELAPKAARSFAEHPRAGPRARTIGLAGSPHLPSGRILRTRGRKKARRGDPRGMKAASPGWPTCWTPVKRVQLAGDPDEGPPYGAGISCTSGPIRRNTQYKTR